MSDMFSFSLRDMQRPVFDPDEALEDSTSGPRAPDDSFISGGSGNGNAAAQLALRTSQRRHSNGMQLFQPKPLVSLQADTPPPPDLSESDLPPHSTVWIGSTDDVKRVLGTFWMHGMEEVTNWRLCGKVLRHSGSHTLVQFETFGFSFPRALLYRDQVTVHDVSDVREQSMKAMTT